MTPNELTTLLAEPLGRQFDQPFKLMILDRVIGRYTRLVRQTLERDPRRRKEFIRPVVVQMERVDNTMHSISIDQVPKALYANGILFDYVGKPDGTNPFISATSETVLRFTESNKYLKDAVYYLYTGERIKVLNNPMIPSVRIDGVFTDIRELDKSDDFWDKDMGIPKDISDLIIEQVGQMLQPYNSTQDEIKAQEEQDIPHR